MLDLWILYVLNTFKKKKKIEKLKRYLIIYAYSEFNNLEMIYSQEAIYFKMFLRIFCLLNFVTASSYVAQN
jgi:hypothetical protein